MLISSFVIAQNNDNKPQNATYIGKPTSVKYVPSIASRSNLPIATLENKTMQDGRASKYEIVPGKGSKGQDVLTKTPHRLKNKVQSRTPSLVFETVNASGSQPTDPAGAVGPNHYFTVTNTAFKIFDKLGNPLTALLNPDPAIFPDAGCCDLTVSYDNQADRWILTFLGVGAQIAISDGPDPVNDGWVVYNYNIVQDYQKLSVWSDGYYMTENTANSNKVHVFERDKMILGDPTAQILSFELPGIITNGFHSPQALNVSSNNFPLLGNTPIVYFQDDAWTGVNTGEDHIKLWTIDVDWTNPPNSTVSAATKLGLDAGTGTVSPFVSVFDGGTYANLTQPEGGQAIDALQGVVMNQAQFRKFDTHNTAVFNFVVDAQVGGELAGVRWYELRQSGDGQPWSIYQEGTYTSPDGKHAWNASLIMDGQGNIGMGYTAMSGPTTPSTVRVGSYYTGRYANDPLGTMTVAEGTILAGDDNIPNIGQGPERYGDYSKIDIDPTDDKKFWYVNEVMSNGRANVAGVFQLAPDIFNDVGVISIDTPINGALTNAETVTVTIFNYGLNDASGFNVTYQIDSGSIISEPFVGTLNSQSSAQHVFATKANLQIEGQTYTINACTEMTNDEDINNDCSIKEVLHELANDIGVVEITSPIDGESLSNETVTIVIENFGTSPQSGFNVNYIINSGTPVVENVSLLINPGETIEYSFTTPANLSEPITYLFNSSTLLDTDSDNSNNSASTSVTNIACMTLMNDSVYPIGPDAGMITTSVINFTDNFIISDVNVTINIDHSWASDVEAKLIAPDGTTEVVLVADRGGSGDNFTNTVFDDQADTLIYEGSVPFTGTFSPIGSLADFNGLQSIGDWTLHINDDQNGDGGNLLDWSLQLCSNSSLSLDEVLVQDGFTVIYRENNQFHIKLSTSKIKERLNLNVLNVLGQNLMWKTLENENGNGYEYKLDMSHVASGVYFIRIGNRKASNIKRIVVK